MTQLGQGLATLVSAQPAGELPVEADLRLRIAATLLEKGELAQARTEFELALAIYRQTGLRTSEGDALTGLGWLEQRAMNLAAAQAHLTDALTIQRELNLQHGVTLTLINLANVHELQGDFSGAYNLRREALDVLERIELLSESNPMLGTRGVRLGILYPEIFEMQARAIFAAAAAVRERSGAMPELEVMIPLVDYERELELMRELMISVAGEYDLVHGQDYLVGTMIELPRACFLADQIAHQADFFSFGTNDLTQMAFGYSRDDAERSFLAIYVEKGILPQNPFQTLDRDGVGRLMKMAVEDGRAARPNLEVGICGEHGGDPASIDFCHMIGQNYVSCSPFRVPIARLAAAHSAIKHMVK